MQTPNGQPSQDYNVDMGVEQICKDLEKVEELQKSSRKLLERIQDNGEKIFSKDLFPDSVDIGITGRSFSAFTLSLISSAQYLRNEACLGKIQLSNLLELTVDRKPLNQPRITRS